MKDYYLILELTRDATPEEVKAAYRDKIRFYHPDRWRDDPEMHQRAEERTKELNEAYQVLSNSRRRADYDRRNPYRPPRPPAWAQPAPDMPTEDEIARQRAWQAEMRRRQAAEATHRRAAETRRAAQRSAAMRLRSFFIGFSLIMAALLMLAWLGANGARSDNATLPAATFFSTTSQSSIPSMYEAMTAIPTGTEREFALQNLSDAWYHADCRYKDGSGPELFFYGSRDAAKAMILEVDYKVENGRSVVSNTGTVESYMLHQYSRCLPSDMIP